jgi:adenine deaminase
MEIDGNIIDIHKRSIYPARISIIDGVIHNILNLETQQKRFICPGLIDAHIHIESSMATPGAFAGPAVSRGTTSVICDPHEIANVLGIEGVRFMIEDALKVPLKFWFGAPSCVPATSFETSGSVIDHDGIEALLKMPEIKYLAEMMNFPGVVHNDTEVHKKLELAKQYGKPVDGHAPGLTGEDLNKYVTAGISTDHECCTIEEALEKIKLGMKVLIREGSAARNLDALKDLIRIHSKMVMLCSDDLHPEMLEKRHINKLIARLIGEGYDMFDVIRACTLNTVIHYKIDAGLLRPGDKADFIVVDDYKKMDVAETWINGVKVFDRGKVQFGYNGAEPANKFKCTPISLNDIKIASKGTRLKVIEAYDGELITKETSVEINSDTFVDSDIANDILKIVVKDRYNDGMPAIAFIKGFGLKEGAFASSVAHDSHNIICVGTTDTDIVNAINEIVKMKGGLSVVSGKKIHSFPLPIAGIMSDKPVKLIAAEYKSLSEKVKVMGCKMSAPFMTLSFMALLVIPELKLSDKGLFDGRKFAFVPLFKD